MILKRLTAVFAVIFLFASHAFALSDAEYLKMKRNSPSFARTDRRLNKVWGDLRKSMQHDDFENLKKDQDRWRTNTRDSEAEKYIDEGYSRTEAYMLATHDRARELPALAEKFKKSSNKNINEPEFSMSGEFENENFSVEDEDEEDKDDKENKQYDFSGNYTRGNSGSMTVIITDRNMMEAEVTFSVENPEATWSATGWVDENVLVLFDKTYSMCQANLTFSENSVKVETTNTEDWRHAMGENYKIDGIYLKKK